MRVHQCPRCELRFSDEHEVKQHLVDDHGVDPEILDRHASGPPAGIHPHRDTPSPSRSDST
jgi:hypothetical protein